MMQFTGLRSKTATAARPRFASYADFWPYYLSQHRDPRNKLLHCAGTTGALACLVLALTTSRGLLPLVPIVGYGFAWLGHLIFERNSPATFRYPVWSLRADLEMCWRLYTGRLGLRQKGGRS